MQRRAIRGSELTPSAFQNVGMLNAEKCVRYLRGIGAEIDDATAESWLDAQAAHRMLNSMKRIVAEGWDCQCAAGHNFYAEFERRRKKKDKRGCPECGGQVRSMSVRWWRKADGSIVDRRPKEDRWRDLHDPHSDGPRFTF